MIPLSMSRPLYSFISAMLTFCFPFIEGCRVTLFNSIRTFFPDNVLGSHSVICKRVIALIQIDLRTKF